MSATSPERTAAGTGPFARPPDLPRALELLARHGDLIERVHEMSQALTAGDFEALVIWCELSRHGGTPGRVHAGGVPLRDLATATGIPRETVRRKLERLAVLGCVVRVDRDWAVRKDDLAATPEAPAGKPSGPPSER